MLGIQFSSRKNRIENFFIRSAFQRARCNLIKIDFPESAEPCIKGSVIFHPDVVVIRQFPFCVQPDLVEHTRKKHDSPDLNVIAAKIDSGHELKNWNFITSIASVSQTTNSGDRRFAEDRQITVCSERYAH